MALPRPSAKVSTAPAATACAPGTVMVGARLASAVIASRTAALPYFVPSFSNTSSSSAVEPAGLPGVVDEHVQVVVGGAGGRLVIEAVQGDVQGGDAAGHRQPVGAVAADRAEAGRVHGEHRAGHRLHVRGRRAVAEGIGDR